MSVDVSQFHQIFFEESFEGLEVMESGLLELDTGEPDTEAINTIFRAAHSIKGGGGTFGFTAISNFTHGMETLLDEMRSGLRLVTREGVDVLLEGVDCLRWMLSAARDGGDFDTDAVGAAEQRLNALLGGEELVTDGDPGTDAVSPETDPAIVNHSCTVKFVPEPQLFQTGNDPVRILRELHFLAVSESSIDISNLPSLEELDPEVCYVSWTIEVAGDVEAEAISEVFEWVENDAEIVVEIADEAAQNGDNSESNGVDVEVEASADNASVPAVSAAPPATERRDGEDRRQQNDRRASAPASSIRVDIEKVDALINMVGELVITQSMLSQFSEDFETDNVEKLKVGLLQLERNTRELQESVMSIRMLPIGFSFNRFPRLVRDLSTKLGKQINLKLSGENTELDKTVMEKIGDPLVHLVRNSLDHGIEMPDVRVANGKSADGTVCLDAYHEGGNIVIEISDDGAGLDTERILEKARERGLVSEHDSLSEEQICDLIFQPGFSTAVEVSDVSGRGVGMDVVRRNIKDLGGVVEVESRRGEGSTFRIRLPLTLAILDGQLVRVGAEVYIVSIVSIIESLQVRSELVNTVAGQSELYRLRDDYIPIVRLYELFGIAPDSQNLQDGLLVVVEGDGKKVGLFVDELLGQQQVVIKSLQTNFRRVEGISGATILGDGTVAMILDVGGLISLCKHGNSSIFRELPSKVA